MRQLFQSPCGEEVLKERRLKSAPGNRPLAEIDAIFLRCQLSGKFGNKPVLPGATTLMRSGIHTI